MGLIVISKVLKYKTFIFAVILVFSLAFFQSNQSLDESSESTISDSNNSETLSIPKTPSIPKIPDLPEENDDNDESVSKTSISISLKTSVNNLNDVDSDSELDETTVEVIEREISSGSIKLSFTSYGGKFKIKEKIDGEDGKTSVKFSSKSNQTTKNESSSETTINLKD